jgi:hypothetical protein
MRFYGVYAGIAAVLTVGATDINQYRQTLSVMFGLVSPGTPAPGLEPRHVVVGLEQRCDP